MTTDGRTDSQTDEQRDMTELIVAIRNSAKGSSDYLVQRKYCRILLSTCSVCNPVARFHSITRSSLAANLPYHSQQYIVS